MQKLSYSDFKAFCQSSNAQIKQFNDWAWAIDGPFQAECLMDDSEKTDFESTFSSVINKQISMRDNSGVPLSASEVPSGDFDTVVSHNFCDNTTWTTTTDSSFELAPPSGKIYTLEKSEVQFEHSLQISGVTKLFIDYYIWHPSYPGTPVVGKTIEFDSIRSIYELGNDHFHSPAINTEIPDGMSTIQFNYRRALKFYGNETSLELAKLGLRLEADGNGDHIEAGGTYATVGFVIVESDI